jgi:Spy/CpxP family protein refolding chaperone
MIFRKEESMKPAFLVALLLSAGAAQAQHAQQDQEKQYLAGAGMGYARPAELNHFPGPMHVLELADQLKLTAAQRATTKELMDAHKAAARGIGAELVAAEREVEALFRDGKVDPSVLARAVRTKAAVEGEYRLSHLETHRRMRELLTDEQVARYDELRGYSAPAKAEHRHKH